MKKVLDCCQKLTVGNRSLHKMSRTFVITHSSSGSFTVLLDKARSTCASMKQTIVVVMAFWTVVPPQWLVLSSSSRNWTPVVILVLHLCLNIAVIVNRWQRSNFRWLILASDQICPPQRVLVSRIVTSSTKVIIGDSWSLLKSSTTRCTCSTKESLIFILLWT